ncbi:hypothetical protein F4V57_12460 [Acinetobacter qingfengensis]|uniref:Uncharacterized protein n=1 Tax=Acinetobacter qingfengensis TaxID=1262585 RepID=A0A1E7QYR1_9GAMM|nr:hypothetical protein [Acinetobacter qingfengensis]KAA8731396.1 hypothetical protein F4V57_12460 [Acinetobacter qingfengensis]OEY92199.1 hypothetical protein BJI46_05450 [Acinetobacter qingfengensis]
MKEAIEKYRQERSTLENEITDFLVEKFADFKEKTGAEVIYLDVEFESSEDLDEAFYISSAFVGTDL